MDTEQEIIGIVVSLIVIVIALVPLCVLFYTNPQEYEVDKVEIVQDNDKTFYHCYCTDGTEVLLTNDDRLFKGKFNSSDIAMELKELEGKDILLKVKTLGYRIQFLSEYQNIISIENLNK